jgi:hypothetical protein
MGRILDLFPVPVDAEPQGFPFGMSFFLEVRSKPGAAIRRIYCTMEKDYSTDSFYTSDHIRFSSVKLRRESLLEILRLIVDGNRVLERSSAQ